MRQITDSQEIKKIALDVLLEIDKICQEQHIRYSLCGGTLLGAIRHKGFIPWDDDIDIFMPRPDYDKFISYCKEYDTPFGFIAHETDPDYIAFFAKAYAKNTRVVYQAVQIKQPDYGIWVDIFPIDGLGNTYKQSKKTISSVSVRRYLLTASVWQKYFRNKWKTWYVEWIRFLFYLCGKLIRNRQKLYRSADRICKRISFDDAVYCGAVGGYGNREILKREVYTDLIDVEFEGHLLKGLKNYDTYLTSLYGDYMKLPPEEQRITHHDYDVYLQE